MRLDYKGILTRHYVLNMSNRQIANELGVSKSGVGEFLQAFKRAEGISFPLPPEMTNEGIFELVYPGAAEAQRRDESYEFPDFQQVFREMKTRKNMTLIYLWNRYSRDCSSRERKAYSYRQFCYRFGEWCEADDPS